MCNLNKKILMKGGDKSQMIKQIKSLIGRFIRYLKEEKGIANVLAAAMHLLAALVNLARLFLA